MKKDLGTLLRNGRINSGLSQIEIAERLGLKSGQSISDWERNCGSGVPVRTLRQLTRLYGLNSEEVFGALLNLQYKNLEESLSIEYFKKSRRKKSV